ncbi:hypothetical protein M758_12G086100 [Ceratodon purpureus]|nr:hypothetical protein M758_12G086100 [Ceratodon purpureus]
MSSIIDTFKKAYEEQRHVVERIRVGLPVEHNTRSTNFVCWRYLELNLEDEPWPECVEEIDKFAAKGKQLWNFWINPGKGEEYPRQIHIRQTKRLLASRESSPLKTRRLNLESCITGQAVVGGIEDPENPESDVISDNIINPQELSSQAEITLSVDLGDSPAKEAAAEPVEQKEPCFDDKTVATHNPSKHGFSKLRRIQKFFKNRSAQSEDAAVRSVKKSLQSRPRLARLAQKIDRTSSLVVSLSLLGTESLNGTPCHGVRLTASRGPKISRELDLFVRSSEVVVKSPLDISIKNFDAEALFPVPNIWSKIGCSMSR